MSQSRSSVFVNNTMSWLGSEAKKNGVRVIYRNNHYNIRFGAHCADDRLEEMLKGTPWEILDSRRISEGCYEYQVIFNITIITTHYCYYYYFNCYYHYYNLYYYNNHYHHYYNNQQELGWLCKFIHNYQCH